MNINRYNYLYDKLKGNTISYKNTLYKKAIRERMADIIKKDNQRKDRKLSYIGMPSLNFFDVIQWQEYVGHITSIEIEKSIYDMQQDRFNDLNLSIDLNLINADIDEFEQYKASLKDVYDIVYFDYWNDLLTDKIERLNILCSMIEYQCCKNTSSFVFAFNHSIEQINIPRYKNMFNIVNHKYEKMLWIEIFCEIQKKIEQKIKSMGYGVSEYIAHLYYQKNGTPRLNHCLYVEKKTIDIYRELLEYTDGKFKKIL